MTREELRDYVDEQRTLNNIPYHVYSALIDGIDTLEQEPRWIPVSERLPEKYCYTLWCASSGEIRTDFFNGEYWEDAKKYGYQVVAWMPLPEPYREVEE